MAPRLSRRHQLTDDYSDDSDSSHKRRRKEKSKEESPSDVDEQQAILESSAYKEALRALEIQRDNNILLINTERDMRIESAKLIAELEERRLNDFFEDEVKELNRKMEDYATTKRASAENRKHRLLTTRAEEHLATSHKKEDTTLTVGLSDAEIVDDIQFMIRGWRDTCKQHHIAPENVVVALPGNQLAVNDLVLSPGTELTMVHDGYSIHGQFVSVEQKEFMFKPDKEKRKKYTLDLVRNGNISFHIDGAGIPLDSAIIA